MIISTFSHDIYQIHLSEFQKSSQDGFTRSTSIHKIEIVMLNICLSEYCLVIFFFVQSNNCSHTTFLEEIDVVFRRK